MYRSQFKYIIIVCVFAWITTACGSNSTPVKITDTRQPELTEVINTPTSTPEPERLLSICMAQEPASLFLYADSSVSARSIRQAVYDGPFDILNYEISSVIMERVPSLENGDIQIEPIAVDPGNLIMDISGNLISLEEGTQYFPSGCLDLSCALTFTIQESVQMDQVVVQFLMRPGIQWSDGTPLTADDSQYSFEIAKDLYPQARADVISHTQSYTALDENTIEWRGIPGYRNSAVQTYFFTPLPRHAWGELSPEDMAVSDVSNQSPLGWGPYRIDEWVKGDHITLSRSSNYFRADEDLPAFDKLVFRFVPDKDEAIAALLAGECDYLDETIHLENRTSQLYELQDSGRVSVIFMEGTAWEHLDFGIAPFDADTRPLLFSKVETRQAVAQCLNRQKIVDELFPGKSSLINSYVSSSHPLYNPDIIQYTYDPLAGAELLESIGWLDSDGDPNTPRISLGIEMIPDGTSFEFELLTTDEDEKQLVALQVQESLAQCGISVTIDSLPWDELFAAGPEGAVFGRNFSMTQFGWASGLQPPCFLYTSAEIPGPFPRYTKGWGGANASGYSNPDYDQVCDQAQRSLPGSTEQKSAHFQAQMIFSEDLPVIPLYQRSKVVVSRSDICGMTLVPSAGSGLWNIENFDYGEGCLSP